MFALPTVFVGGAGASVEFGMPVVSQLNASIALSLNFTLETAKALRLTPASVSARADEVIE